MILSNLGTALLLGISLAAAQTTTAPQKKGDPQAHQGQGQGEDIRGTMSLKEISQKTSIPLDHFQKTLKLDKSVDVNIPVRDWIHSKGMTMQNVRDAAKAYKPVKK